MKGKESNFGQGICGSDPVVNVEVSTMAEHAGNAGLDLFPRTGPLDSVAF